VIGHFIPASAATSEVVKTKYIFTLVYYIGTALESSGEISAWSIEKYTTGICRRPMIVQKTP